MARDELPCDYVTFRRAESWIHQAVTNYRNSGLRLPQAIDEASTDLEFSPRRVRAFYEGEAHRLLLAEWEHLKRRFTAHLKKQAAHHIALARKNSAMARNLELERLEMNRLRQEHR